MSECIRCGEPTADMQAFHCSVECQEADAAVGRRARWAQGATGSRECGAAVGWCERHKKRKRCISVLGHSPGHSPVCGSCRREERGSESQTTLGVVA